VDAVGLGCVVLWSLKQGSEQLLAVRLVSFAFIGGEDVLWQCACWTFVLLWLGVADAAERVGHGRRVDVICGAIRFCSFALRRVRNTETSREK
jgi:hypothetical protein